MVDFREFFNQSAETLSPDQFRKTQEVALWKQLAYVRDNSTFYQAKYAREGIDLGRIRNLEEFQRLPFTYKTELRDSQIDHPPLGSHAAVPVEQVARIYSTSGTTGRPTYIGVTRNDLKVWSEAASRAMWTAGVRPGDVVPLVVSPFLIAASYADAIVDLGATVVPIGVNATDRLVGAFQNLGANALLGTSSMPMHFAESLSKRGVDPSSLGLKIVLAGGEPGASIPEYRRQVEETFGCTFLEMMGNGDMCGEIFAECRYKRGMHFIAAGIVYVEIIDPETGQVLDIEEDTSGELVYTSLARECMPLVRFRTRDHVVVTQTECECGRTGFGVRCIGRTDDMLIVQGVNVYPSAVKDVVSNLAPLTSGAVEIQLTQRPPDGWQPPIWIKVESGPAHADPTKLKADIEGIIREKLIFRAKVEIVPMGSLPTYEYKAKLVRKVYEEAVNG
jgi:phenylacetate-CoA ligase